MLQQTRVKFIEVRYVQFLKRFPSVKSIAESSIGEVLNEWQGIGYYSRARNLHLAAKKIISEYNGIIPQKQELLIRLPGVGLYTAAAIGSIAFDQKIPAIDANWLRVVSRILNYQELVDTKKSLSYLEEFAKKIISKKRPGDFNQAIMDIGSKVCMPNKIHCEFCPLMSNCVSYKNKTSLQIPLKRKKKNKRPITFFQFFAESNGKFVMAKRKGIGLFQNLWELPSWQADGHLHDCSEEKKKQNWESFFGMKYRPVKKIFEKKIQLTHLEILFVVFGISVKSTKTKISGATWVKKEGSSQEGISSAQREIISKIQEQNLL